MSCGLELFSALSQAPNAEDQAAIIFAHPYVGDNFLTDAILVYRKAEGITWSDRDGAYQIVIPFTNDNEGPNAALPWSRLAGLDFFYKDRDFMRSWGYVMWDLRRLTEWKVLEQDAEVWLGGKEVAPSLEANT